MSIMGNCTTNNLHSSVVLCCREEKLSLVRKLIACKVLGADFSSRCQHKVRPGIIHKFYPKVMPSPLFSLAGKGVDRDIGVPVRAALSQIAAPTNATAEYHVYLTRYL